jgi:hypothetical protein
MNPQIPGHTFRPSACDDYYCEICHHPRALHDDDGFQPSNAAPPIPVSMDPNVQYYGGTPRERLDHEVRKGEK